MKGYNFGGKRAEMLVQRIAALKQEARRTGRPVGAGLFDNRGSALPQIPPPPCHCAGKTPYENRGAAKLALRRMATRRAGKHSRGQMDAYPCTHCGDWHIGRHSF